MSEAAMPAVYRLHWRGRNVAPGGHKASLLGPGHDFYLQAPYGCYGETRKLDLRASAADPQQRIWVRVHRQAASVPVFVIADVSRSMCFVGTADRWAMLQTVVAAIAESATRSGDRFGFIACDEHVRRDLSLPAMRNAALGREIVRKLAGFEPTGRSASGLLHAAEHLPSRRALVFLVSDLHLPGEIFERVLRSLSIHDVVPVVLADSSEGRLPRRHGLARVRDLESGDERLLLLRPGLAKRYAERWSEHRAALNRIALSHGRAPLVFEDRYEALRFNRYFCTA